MSFPGRDARRGGARRVFERFGELHRAEYGHVFPDSPIEIVNIRVTGIGRMAKIAAPRPREGGSLAAALVKTAPCAFRVDGGLETLATPFYRREALPLDSRSPGRRSSCKPTRPPSCRPMPLRAPTRAAI